LDPVHRKFRGDEARALQSDANFNELLGANRPKSVEIEQVKHKPALSKGSEAETDVASHRKSPFCISLLDDGVTATTINRSLEIVRTVLNRAARSYRDDVGRPWLEGMPPLIRMLPEARRQPYPITWEEQDRLFPKLSARLARMALFAVNTGLRESNVCRLEWAREVKVPEIERSVFVIPQEAFKSKRAHSSS